MKLSKILAAVSFAACIIFSSCDYFFPPFSGDKVSPEETYNYLIKHQNDKDIMILDVRTKDEYVKSHLLYAVWMDYSDPSFPGTVEKLDKNKTYIIYSGDDGKSANTFQLMKELNFGNAHYISGGINEWQKHGFPVQ